METHFAWVFVTDRHVYKMKKAARRATMDYRTLASRERGCRNELELNRRLAPTVYLDVVPLSRERGGDLVLGPGERVVEWLVKMRRLPAARLLDRAMAAGAVSDADLDGVLRLLSAFYRGTLPAPMRPRAWLERLERLTRRSAEELQAPDLRLPAERIEPVLEAQLLYIAAAEPFLAPRASRLVDAHGDLRPEHVFLGPEPCVIDCLEYDPDLRRLDPAEEITNLALGCERLGRADVAARLLRGYRAAMDDPVPDSLFAFYTSQRAVIAARLAAWHVRDPMYAAEWQSWIDQARSCLDRALRHARSALQALQEEESVGGRHRPALEQRHERSSG